jgi:hypothetical protein
MTDYPYQRQGVRYGMNVVAEVTDLDSQSQRTGQTSDVSMFGCGITGISEFSQGSRVRVRLLREHTEVVVLGRVVYSRPDIGLGIAFTSIEPKDERALTEWIDELAGPRNGLPDRPVWERY